MLAEDDAAADWLDGVVCACEIDGARRIKLTKATIIMKCTFSKFSVLLLSIFI
jgi:hypothetical protein